MSLSSSRHSTVHPVQKASHQINGFPAGAGRAQDGVGGTPVSAPKPVRVGMPDRKQNKTLSPVVK